MSRRLEMIGKIELRGQIDYLEAETRAQIRRICIASGHLPIALGSRCDPSPLIPASLDLLDEAINAGFRLINKYGIKLQAPTVALVTVWLAYQQLKDQGTDVSPAITKTKLRGLVKSSVSTADNYQKRITSLIKETRMQ